MNSTPIQFLNKIIIALLTFQMAIGPAALYAQEPPSQQQPPSKTTTPPKMDEDDEDDYDFIPQPPKKPEEAKQPAPQSSKATIPPTEKKDSDAALKHNRATVLQKIHLASWTLIYLIEKEIPWAKNLLPTDFVGFFRSYLSCMDKDPGVNGLPLDALDASIKEVYQEISGFWNTRIDTINSTSFILLNPGKSTRIIRSKDGAICQPDVWDETSFSKTEWKQSEKLMQAKETLIASAQQGIQRPFFEAISMKSENTPFTAREYRAAMSIVDTILYYRDLLKDHYHAKGVAFSSNPQADSPAPEWNIPQALGRVLAIQNRDYQADTDANKRVEDLVMGLTKKNTIAKFIPCSQKEQECGTEALPPFDAQDYCFCPSKRENRGLVSDKLILQAKADNPRNAKEPNYGGQLELERVALANAHLTELTVMATQLPSHISNKIAIPQSCQASNQPDIKQAVENYKNIFHVKDKIEFIQRFGLAVEELAMQFDKGELAFPIPTASRTQDGANQVQNFAQSLAQSFIQTTISRFVGNQNISPTIVAMQQNILRDMKQLPFYSLITEGSRIVKTADKKGAKLEGVNLSQIFAAKLLVWFQLVQKDLVDILDIKDLYEKKNEAKFVKLVQTFIVQVLAQTLADALKHYSLSFIQAYEWTDQRKEESKNSPEALVDTHLADQIWEQAFAGAARQLFAQAPLQNLMARSAQMLVMKILNHPDLSYEKFYTLGKDQPSIERSQLRIAVIEKQSDQAHKADQVLRYMENLATGQEGLNPKFILPFAWSGNYYAKDAACKDTTQAPAPFQIADGHGHEGMYPFFTLNPVATADAFKESVEDYLHLKAGMKSLFARYRDDLIKKFKSDTPQRRRLTDEWLKTHVAQNVQRLDSQHLKEDGTGRVETVRIDSVTNLADAILEKMDEILEAKPSKMPTQRAFTYTQSFRDLQKWLGTKKAVESYYQNVFYRAQKLHDSKLKPLWKVEEKERDASWKKHWDSLIQDLQTREVLVPKTIATETLYKVYTLQDTRVNAARQVIKKLDDARTEMVNTGTRQGSSEDPTAWIAYCEKDIKRCRELVERVLKTYDEPLMAELFKARFIVKTRNILTAFFKGYLALEEGEVPYSASGARALEKNLYQKHYHALNGASVIGQLSLPMVNPLVGILPLAVPLLGEEPKSEEDLKKFVQEKIHATMANAVILPEDLKTLGKIASAKTARDRLFEFVFHGSIGKNTFDSKRVEEENLVIEKFLEEVSKKADAYAKEKKLKALDFVPSDFYKTIEPWLAEQALSPAVFGKWQTTIKDVRAQIFQAIDKVERLQSLKHLEIASEIGHLSSSLATPVSTLPSSQIPFQLVEKEKDQLRLNIAAIIAQRASRMAAPNPSVVQMTVLPSMPATRFEQTATSAASQVGLAMGQITSAPALGGALPFTITSNSLLFKPDRGPLEWTFLKIWQLVHEEANYLSTDTIAYLEGSLEEQLYLALSQIIYPDYKTFASYLQTKIADASIPVVESYEEMQNILKRVDEIRTTAHLASRLEQYSSRQKEIDHHELTVLEHKFERARKRLATYQEVSLLLENYFFANDNETLAEREDSVVAKALKTLQEQKGDNLWQAFYQDRFLGATLLAGTENPVELKDFLDDLNEIGQAVNTLDVVPALASQFLGKTVEYCHTAFKNPHNRYVFEKNYYDSIAADKDLPKYQQAVASVLEPASAPLTSLATLALTAKNARLDRLVEWKKLLATLPKEKQKESEQTALLAKKLLGMDLDEFLNLNTFSVDTSKGYIEGYWDFVVNKASAVFAKRDNKYLDPAYYAEFPSAYEFCNIAKSEAWSLTKELFAYTTPIASKLAPGYIPTVDKLTPEFRARYWKLVQAISDRFFNENSKFGPIWDQARNRHVWFDSAPAVVTASNTPAKEEPKAEAKKGEKKDEKKEETDPLPSDTKILQTLVSFVQLPGFNAERFQKLIIYPVFSDAQISMFADPSFANRALAINTLSLVERRDLYKAIRESLKRYLTVIPLQDPKAKNNMLWLEFFDEKRVTEYTYEKWWDHLQGLLAAWNQNKDRFKDGRVNYEAINGPDKSMTVAQAGFEGLTNEIFRVFLDHTSYRWIEGRWVLPVVRSEDFEAGFDTYGVYNRVIPVSTIQMNSLYVQSRIYFAQASMAEKQRLVEALKVLIEDEKLRIQNRGSDKKLKMALHQRAFGLNLPEEKKIESSEPVFLSTFKEKATPATFNPYAYLDARNRMWQNPYLIQDPLMDGVMGFGASPTKPQLPDPKFRTGAPPVAQAPAAQGTGTPQPENQPANPSGTETSAQAKPAGGQAKPDDKKSDEEKAKEEKTKTAVATVLSFFGAKMPEAKNTPPIAVEPLKTTPPPATTQTTPAIPPQKTALQRRQEQIAELEARQKASMEAFKKAQEENKKENEAKEKLLLQTQNLVVFYSVAFGAEENTNSIDAWIKSYQQKNLNGQLAYSVDKTIFKTQWQANGKKAEETKAFEAFAQRLASDPEAQKRFEALKKGTYRGKHSRYLKHIWDRYPTLEKALTSPLYKEVKAQFELFDDNAQVLPLPETYPYYVVALNWTIRQSRTKALNPAQPRKVGPLLESEKGWHLGELVYMMGLDLQDLNMGWKRLLHERSKPQDWYRIAESKKIAMVGVKDRKFQRARIGVDSTLTPKGTPSDYKPLPLAGRLDWTQPQDEQAYRQGFQQNASYLPVRSESYFVPEAGGSWWGDRMNRWNDKGEYYRSFYSAMSSISQQIIGERQLQNYGKVRSTVQDQKDKWLSFGTHHPIPAKTNAATFTLTSLADLARYARANGFETTERELETIASAYNSFADFVNSAQELIAKHPHENGGKLAYHPGAKAQLEQMRAAFANQEQIRYKEKLRELVDDENLVPMVILDAFNMTRTRIALGKKDKDKERLYKLLGVVQNYYKLKAQVLTYWEGLEKIIHNIGTGLDTLCSLDVKEIHTEQQFKAHSNSIAATKLQYMTGFREYIQGFVPGGISAESQALLESLADEKTNWEKFKKHYHTDTLNQVIFVGFLLMMTMDQPVLSAYMATTPGLGWSMGALATVLGAYFGIEGYEDYMKDFYYDPIQNAMRAEVAHREFRGIAPILKERELEGLESASRAVEDKKWSAGRWALRLWSVGIAGQLLKPGYMAAYGGIQKILSDMFPKWMLRRQLTTYARGAFNISPEELLKKGPEEAYEMLLQKRAAEVIRGHLSSSTSIQAQTALEIWEKEGLEAVVLYIKESPILSRHLDKAIVDLMKKKLGHFTDKTVVAALQALEKEKLETFIQRLTTAAEAGNLQAKEALVIAKSRYTDLKFKEYLAGLGKASEGDVIYLDGDAGIVNLLRLDARRQAEKTAQELGMIFDPVNRTFRPNPRYAYSNSMLKAQASQKRQMEGLSNILGKLEQKNPQLTIEEFAELLAGRGHAIDRYTGLIWQFTGIPSHLNFSRIPGANSEVPAFIAAWRISGMPGHAALSTAGRATGTILQGVGKVGGEMLSIIPGVRTFGEWFAKTNVSRWFARQGQSLAQAWSAMGGISKYADGAIFLKRNLVVHYLEVWGATYHRELYEMLNFLRESQPNLTMDELYQMMLVKGSKHEAKFFSKSGEQPLVDYAADTSGVGMKDESFIANSKKIAGELRYILNNGGFTEAQFTRAFCKILASRDSIKIARFLMSAEAKPSNVEEWYDEFLATDSEVRTAEINRGLKAGEGNKINESTERGREFFAKRKGANTPVDGEFAFIKGDKFDATTGNLAGGSSRLKIDAYLPAGGDFNEEFATFVLNKVNGTKELKDVVYRLLSMRRSSHLYASNRDYVLKNLSEINLPYKEHTIQDGYDFVIAYVRAMETKAPGWREMDSLQVLELFSPKIRWDEATLLRLNDTYFSAGMEAGPYEQSKYTAAEHLGFLRTDRPSLRSIELRVRNIEHALKNVEAEPASPAHRLKEHWLKRIEMAKKELTSEGSVVRNEPPKLAQTTAQAAPERPFEFFDHNAERLDPITTKLAGGGSKLEGAGKASSFKEFDLAFAEILLARIPESKEHLRDIIKRLLSMRMSSDKYARSLRRIKEIINKPEFDLPYTEMDIEQAYEYVISHVRALELNAPWKNMTVAQVEGFFSPGFVTERRYSIPGLNDLFFKAGMEAATYSNSKYAPEFILGLPIGKETPRYLVEKHVQQLLKALRSVETAEGTPIREMQNRWLQKIQDAREALLRMHDDLHPSYFVDGRQVMGAIPKGGDPRANYQSVVDDQLMDDIVKGFEKHIDNIDVTLLKQILRERPTSQRLEEALEFWKYSKGKQILSIAQRERIVETYTWLLKAVRHIESGKPFEIGEVIGWTKMDRLVAEGHIKPEMRQYLENNFKSSLTLDEAIDRAHLALGLPANANFDQIKTRAAEIVKALKAFQVENAEVKVQIIAELAGVAKVITPDFMAAVMEKAVFPEQRNIMLEKFAERVLTQPLNNRQMLDELQKFRMDALEQVARSYTNQGMGGYQAETMGYLDRLTFYIRSRFELTRLRATGAPEPEVAALEKAWLEMLSRPGDMIAEHPMTHKEAERFLKIVLDDYLGHPLLPKTDGTPQEQVDAMLNHLDLSVQRMFARYPALEKQPHYRQFLDRISKAIDVIRNHETPNPMASVLKAKDETTYLPLDFYLRPEYARVFPEGTTYRIPNVEEPDIYILRYISADEAQMRDIEKVDVLKFLEKQEAEALKRARRLNEQNKTNNRYSQVDSYRDLLVSEIASRHNHAVDLGDRATALRMRRALERIDMPRTRLSLKELPPENATPTDGSKIQIYSEGDAVKAIQQQRQMWQDISRGKPPGGEEPPPTQRIIVPGQ